MYPTSAEIEGCGGKGTGSERLMSSWVFPAISGRLPLRVKKSHAHTRKHTHTRTEREREREKERERERERER